MSFRLSLFNGKTDTLPKEAQRTWAQMCERVEHPIVREAKDGALFSPALFRPAYRLQENVTELSLLVLDYDHHASFVADLVTWRELKICFAAYTTHSHRRVTKSNQEAEERFRVVVPLAAPISAEKFPALWQWAARLSDGKIDSQAQDTSRMYYTPAIATEDAPYQSVIVDGEPLDWRSLDLHSPVPEATTSQSSPASSANEFNSWAELHAETAARIRKSSKARTDRRGWTSAPGVCHGSTSGRALYISPDGAYGCHKGCTTAQVRDSFGLRQKPASGEAESHATQKQPDEAEPLCVVCMADIEPEQVSWLWHPYIAIGKLTILEGDPGLGKSWLTCAIACAVSRGRGLPSTEPFTAGNVLMLSAEDGLGDTLRPRLDAVSADVRRIFALNEPLTLDTPGLLRLEAAIIEYKPVLVIIDPLFGFTGGKVDIHRANECRAISAPLATIAERHGCAMLAVRHLGKSRGGGHALNAGIGSIDFTAAARSVLLVGRDPDDGQKRAIVQTKNNLAPHGEAIGYKLEDSQFYWTGLSDLTAGRILAAESDEGERSALIEAVDFLRTALSSGRESKAIKDEAKQGGITETTLRRAKAQLKVRARKVGMPGSHYQKWMWELPGNEAAQTRAEDGQIAESEHLRASGADNDTYSQHLAEDAQNLEFEHLQTATVSILTDEEEELAARLEFDEHLPRAEAERRAREWYAPVPF